MNSLVIVSRPLHKLSSGYDLRVLNLCRHMRGDLHLAVVPFDEYRAQGPDQNRFEIFSSIAEMSLAEWGKASARRHFRVEEFSFLRLAHPAAYRALVDRLNRIIEDKQIDTLLVFGVDLAGLALDLNCSQRVLDVCDSTTLRMRRHRQQNDVSFADRLQEWRWSNTESNLIDRFQIVTTIGPTDTQEIALLSKKPDAANLFSIPNGVNDAFLHADTAASRQKRGIAFWGNLPFPPNRDAMRYFVREVYLNEFADEDIELCIVGRGAEDWLSSLAASDPRIKLHGFVDDLPKVVSQYPIMINPMLTGGGMKNKVLEAFALGMSVISTSLGVDAFPELKHERDLLLADNPVAFAAGIRRLLSDLSLREALGRSGREVVQRDYQWDVVAARWNRLVSQA